jgi:hypothetical protein
MKKLKWLYFLIFAFLLGYSYTALVYNGIWPKLIESLGTIRFHEFLLWLIFTFYISLTLHELGHFFAFVIQKIKIRALYLTIFVFYKNEKGWHFTIRPKLWVLGGGLVVPDLGKIEDDQDFDQLRNRFAKALIAAPVVTMSFLLISIITFILVLLYSSNMHLIGIISILTFYITLLSSLFIYTFTLHNTMFYGDFVAYKKMKTDPIFQLTQINQYTMFSMVETEKTTEYLFNKTKNVLKEISLDASIFHTMLLTSYLDQIIRGDEEVDPIIDSKIRALKLSAYTHSEHGIYLAYDLCYYHYKTKNVAKAYQMFEDIKKRTSKKLNPKLITYLEKKTLHVLNIEYQDAFFMDKNNYYVGNSWIFDILIDPIETLKEYHSPLPFIEYSSPVLIEDFKLEDEKSDS